MAKWTVLISATVTHDLREAILGDMSEAQTALRAIRPPDIAVRVWLHGPAYKKPETVVMAGGR